MNISGRQIETIKREEGFKEFAYQDTEGYWTIGYGFLVDERRGVGLPREIADKWLEYALKERWERLIAAKPWIEDQPEDVQVALASMVYQLGVMGLLQFRMMFAALEAGDREEAAREALNSRWAEQTPARAERMAALISGTEES